MYSALHRTKHFHTIIVSDLNKIQNYLEGRDGDCGEWGSRSEFLAASSVPI